MATGSFTTWSTDMTLVAVSLNIGGRNTNPLEFLLAGDSSEEGSSATQARVHAQEAMVDAECGPARMASTERAIVDEIISSIISELGGDRKYIDALLSSSTWADVYNAVRSDKPGLFNALNLTTLQLKRPSIIEAPTDCAHFSARDGYLQGWGAWYRSLDRKSDFWTQDMEKKAAKKNIDRGTALAGLLVFDLLGLAAASRISVGNTAIPMAESLTRSAVFTVMAAIVETLPFATDTGKHNAAAKFFSTIRADIVAESGRQAERSC